MSRKPLMCIVGSHIYNCFGQGRPSWRRAEARFLLGILWEMETGFNCQVEYSKCGSDYCYVYKL